MNNSRYVLNYRPNAFIYDNKEHTELFAFAEDDDPNEIIKALNDFNEQKEEYMSLFADILELALSTKEIRNELLKGILNMFEEAETLEEAKDMIRSYLE